MKLTDVPSISKGLPRTVAGAQQAISRYERANADLPLQQRRLLALAACARYFGRRILEEAVGGSLPRTPFRDWSWRWWNVLVTTNLEEHWDEFARLAQKNGIRSAAKYLRSKLAPEAYLNFLRRAGTNPNNDHRRKNNSIIWTKGGCWRIESPFTQLLVLHKHLPQRELRTKWHRKMGHDGIRRLERELMNLVNPDHEFRGDAVKRAIDYACWRIRDMHVGIPHKDASPKAAVWFFGTDIPSRKGTYKFDSRQNKVILVRDYKLAKTLEF